MLAVFARRFQIWRPFARTEIAPGKTSGWMILLFRERESGNERLSLEQPQAAFLFGRRRPERWRKNAGAPSPI